MKRQEEAKAKEDQQKKIVMDEMEVNFQEFKKQEKAMEKQKIELQNELEFMKRQLKEKQQLHRISTYKLNDLKRNIIVQKKAQAAIEQEKEEKEFEKRQKAEAALQAPSKEETKRAVRKPKKAESKDNSLTAMANEEHNIEQKEAS